MAKAEISGYTYDTVLWRASHVEFYDRITRQRLPVSFLPKRVFFTGFSNITSIYVSIYNNCEIDKLLTPSTMFEINFLRKLYVVKTEHKKIRSPQFCWQILCQANKELRKYRVLISAIATTKTFFLNCMLESTLY